MNNVYIVALLMIVAIALSIVFYTNMLKLSSTSTGSIDKSAGQFSGTDIRVLNAKLVGTGKAVLGELDVYARSSLRVYSISLKCGYSETTALLVYPRDLSIGTSKIFFAALGSDVKPGDICTIIVTSSRGTTFINKGIEPLENRRVYVLYFPQIPLHYVCGWINPLEIKDVAAKLGLNFEIVSDFERLEAILRNANAHTVIINLHGEVTPMPPWYFEQGSHVSSDSWVGEPPRWKEWLGMIRSAIERGAVWINVGSIPFYYVAADTSLYYQCGVVECGNNTWTSWVGYHGLLKVLWDNDQCVDKSTLTSRFFVYWPPSLGVVGKTATATSLMKQLSRLSMMLGVSVLTDPPSLILGVNDRPLLFKSLPKDARIEHVYYLVDSSYGEAYLGFTMRLGKGKLVMLTFACSDTRDAKELAMTASAIMLYELINK